MLDNHLHRFCGGRYQLAVETVTLRLSGMSAEVTREFYRCNKCADEQRTVEQRETAERSAVERIRAAHALLAPKEIRQLRESIGVTPAQFGELLYGTPRGIVEGWERGRYLQNRETDAMLRSLRDRDTLERRAAKAGVALPVPELLAGASTSATAGASAAAGTSTPASGTAPVTPATPSSES